VEPRRLFQDLELDWRRLSGPPVPSPVSEGQGLTLARFRTPHLRSIPALRTLYAEAVSGRLLPESEASFIAFIATAAYCLRVGNRPAALFVHLLRARVLSAPTLKDEDRACAALRRHLARERRGSAFLRPSRPEAGRGPDSDGNPHHFRVGDPG
jgi:hypothetical protein